MRKTRGFKIGRRLFGISKWVFRRTWTRPGYQRLGSPDAPCKSKAISKIISWGRRLTSGAKSICSVRPGSGYLTIGQPPVDERQVHVPKGHLAVYVGQKDGDFHRVLVPVIYINHPLFGELLRDAEEEFGFNHQGGITIPCCYSEFEQVKTRIEVGSGRKKRVFLP